MATSALPLFLASVTEQMGHMSPHFDSGSWQMNATPRTPISLSCQGQPHVCQFSALRRAQGQIERAPLTLPPTHGNAFNLLLESRNYRINPLFIYLGTRHHLMCSQINTDQIIKRLYDLIRTIGQIGTDQPPEQLKSQRRCCLTMKGR